MKKLFQRLDDKNREYNREIGSSSTTTTGNNYVGKVFTVGRFHCTVEDTIAEGLNNFLFLLIIVLKQIFLIDICTYFSLI
jgi:hypothetical protein